MRFTPRLLAASTLATLTACSPLTSAYVRPPLPDSPRWTSKSDTGSTAADRWWTIFGDRNLNQLIGGALARNSNIVSAAIRARRAQLQTDLAANALFPKLSGNASSTGTLPLNGAKSSSASSSSLSVAYEVDLWGKLASRHDAATFEAIATTQDLQAARIAVIGTTIETYWRLAHANETMESAEQSLAYSRETLQFVKSQVAAGASSEIELNEAVQTVEAQAAALAQLRLARAMIRTSLVMLLDGDSLPVPEPSRLPRTLPKIRPGLPSTLLSRRPDLRAAELRLRATLKGVDATRASFYPSISLTGSTGGSSADLVSIVSNPVASLGAGIVLPFLNLKDMGLAVKVSEAQYEEAVVSFRRALLDAFADVANALAARTEQERRRTHLIKALKAAGEVERLTERRYKAGVVPLRIFLDAHERRRAARLALIDNRLAEVLVEITLYRAIGGATKPPGA